MEATQTAGLGLLGLCAFVSAGACGQRPDLPTALAAGAAGVDAQSGSGGASNVGGESNGGAGMGAMAGTAGGPGRCDGHAPAPSSGAQTASESVLCYVPTSAEASRCLPAQDSTLPSRLLTPVASCGLAILFVIDEDAEQLLPASCAPQLECCAQNPGQQPYLPANSTCLQRLAASLENRSPAELADGCAAAADFQAQAYGCSERGDAGVAGGLDAGADGGIDAGQQDAARAPEAAAGSLCCYHACTASVCI